MKKTGEGKFSEDKGVQIKPNYEHIRQVCGGTPFTTREEQDICKVRERDGLERSKNPLKLAPPRNPKGILPFD